MFCPVCKSEYREGFTRCNDCNVALVASLPSSGGDSSGPPSVLDSPQLLWQGTDEMLLARLTASLTDAKIPYHEGDAPARLFYRSLDPPLQLWTLTKDHQAALQILKSLGGDVGDSDAEESDIAAEEDSEDILPEEAPGPEVDDIVEDFQPKDATVEVWRGDSSSSADTFRDCLLENGIGCVIDNPTANEESLRVLPKDETRAREIIREIIEGTPPE